MVITWQHTDESGRCLRARIRVKSLETGACVGPQAVYALGEQRQAELSRFLGLFYTFEADTPAGRVTFAGTGSGLGKTPFPVEERMLATWAWAVSEEARSGHAPAWELALAWQRDEGGRCEKLTVYLSGFAEAFACDGQPAALGRQPLTPDQLALLYDWHDRFQSTPAERFELSGRGTGMPDEADRAAIGRYAQSLFAALAAVAPDAAGALVKPLVTAPYVRFDNWSPDSRWLAYWLSSQADVDSQFPYAMPGGTLHFANVQTGETCAAPQFHPATDRQALVEWSEDGAAVVLMIDEVFKGLPCQAGPFALLPDYTPAEQGRPDPALSPGGRYQAATALLSSSENGVLTFETILTDTVEMRAVQSVRWQISDRLGDYGLGGEWASPTQFLIYETLAHGPLLIDVDQGVIPALTDLFSLQEIPSILNSPEGYGLEAQVAPGPEPDTYHLVVSGVGLEANFPPAMLYHAKSGVVEILPYRDVWGFSTRYEWLFLYETVEHEGYESGYHLWMRRLEDVGDDWRLIAPKQDHVLWSADEGQMAFTQNETALVWQTFPAGEPLGRWDTSPYSARPEAFSPDGHYLVLVSNLPGLWQYALFLLERPQGSP